MFLVGDGAHRHFQQTARHEASTRHETPAVLVHNAPRHPEPGSDEAKETLYPVTVRFTDPHGRTRTANTDVEPGLRAGNTVRVWVSDEGKTTAPPLTPDQVLSRTMGCALLAAMAVPLIGAALSRTDPLYAAFVLAVAMGLRRGELVGLRWSDVDLDNRVLHVRQQTQRRRGTLCDDDPKSRRSRVVPMPALRIAPLRWHRLRQRDAFTRSGVVWSETGYVFATRNGRLVEPRSVYRSFTRVAADEGLRVVRLHDARHGCATLLTAAGVAPRVIMEILGHSQISITMDVYTHVVHHTQREAISHMDRLLRRRRPAA
nr:tyrosine-type recombinase/integrase [Streptomyces sp. PKU-MA01144]